MPRTKAIRRRRPAGRKGYAAAKKAVKAVLAKELELKKTYFSGQVTLNASVDNGYIDLGLIGQGLTSATRIGNRIHVKSIRYRLYTDMGTVDSNLRISFLKTKTNAMAGASMPNLEGFFDKDRFMVKKDWIMQRTADNRYRVANGFCKGGTGYIQYDDGTTTSSTKGSCFVGLKGHGTTSWTHVIGYQIEVAYTDA